MSVSEEELTEKYKNVYQEEYSPEAEGWVVKNPSFGDNVFSHFGLLDFLYYDLSCIPQVTFINFAKALKLKIMEEIAEFEPPYRDQLLVLCQITDGSQTERNQSIITRRMLTIIYRQAYSKYINYFYSQEDLTSKYFPSSREAEKESEVKSSFAASEANGNYQFYKKGVEESGEMKTTESHKTEERINASENGLYVRTSVCNTKALDEANDTTHTSQEELSSKSLAMRKTFKKREYIHEYIEEWGRESPPYQQSSTKSAVAVHETKEDFTDKSVSSNGAYQEAVVKNRNLENTTVKHAFSNRATPDDFTNTSEDEWDCTSSVKHNNIECDENGKTGHNYSKEERNINPVKAEISNRRIDGNDQSSPPYEYTNSGRNKNSSSKEKRNGCSNFAGRSMRRFFSDIRNESASNRSSGRRPLVKAEEFNKRKDQPSKEYNCGSREDASTFSHFSLSNLVFYDVCLMPSDVLQNYSSVLKLRVLEIISGFEPLYKEELEVLCEITDGTQTDRNLKIICSRICAIVHKNMSNQHLNHKINPVMPRYP